MKSTLIALLLALSLPAYAAAATVSLPSDAPVATIDIPDSWNPTEIEHGVEAMPEDEAIYLSIEVADEKTSDSVIDGIFSFLDENGVTVDPATQKESKDKLNGMDIITYDWDGKDADGPVSIGVIIVSPKPGKLLLMTYWGTKGEQDKHETDIVGIIASLKPAN